MLISSSPNDRSLLWNINDFTLRKELKDKKLKSARFVGSSSILVERTTGQFYLIDINTFNLVKKIDEYILVSSLNTSKLLFSPKEYHHEHRNNYILQLDEEGRESHLILKKDNIFSTFRKVMTPLEESSDQSLVRLFEKELQIQPHTSHISSSISYVRQSTSLTKMDERKAFVKKNKRPKRLKKPVTVHKVLIEIEKSSHLSEYSYFIALDSFGRLVTVNNHDSPELSSLKKVRFSFLDSISPNQHYPRCLIGLDVNGDAYILNLPVECLIQGRNIRQEDFSLYLSSFLPSYRTDDHYLCRRVIKNEVVTIATCMIEKYTRFPMKYRLFLWKWLLDPLIDIEEFTCNRTSNKQHCHLEFGDNCFRFFQNQLNERELMEGNLLCTLSQLVHWNESLVQHIDSLWQVIDFFASLFSTMKVEEDERVNKKFSLTLFNLIATLSKKGFFSFSHINLPQILGYIRCFTRSSSSWALNERSCISKVDDDHLPIWKCENLFNIRVIGQMVVGAFTPILSKSQLVVLWDHLITKGIVFQNAFIASIYIKVQMKISNDEKDICDTSKAIQLIAQKLKYIRLSSLLMISNDILKET